MSSQFATVTFASFYAASRIQALSFASANLSDTAYSLMLNISYSDFGGDL